MKALTVNEIREAFLAFFESKEHLRLPSFSLIPENDPSILLINAGMTPMKKWFTGAETPPRKRVASCQKCIRTPDIERVGQTARHGTFFEMLGNFSFGDYFKKEIIPWAWEFCTEILEMPAEKLYATVYLDDDEAYEIWRDVVGMPESHISRFGKEDNFWEHGTGPCGPCSEIFFDRGEKYGCGSPDCKVGCDCDRYIEFWNLVFTQFDRDEDGGYTPLKQKNIDTGAGLERFGVVLQDVDNFFDVDNIRAILAEVARMAGQAYGQDAKTDVALRVVTDHIRSTVMMISDGILPGNEGRGYVLRRLLRRAARYGRLLEIPSPFLSHLAEHVLAQSALAYPQLNEKREHIQRVILREEESFDQTIQQGLLILQEDIEEAKKSRETRLAGDKVFRLHDTFGFPLDLTREIARENDLEIDEHGFNEAMARQKAMGRKAQLEKTGSAWDRNALPEHLQNSSASCFSGYEKLQDQARVLHILKEDEKGLTEVAEGHAGEALLLLLDRTPFYAESGGQTGDQGSVSADGFLASVDDTERSGSGVVLHHITIREGVLRQGQQLDLKVDRTRRLATARNHSATHLLHQALRNVLGTHVEQAGSLVTPDRLRFDFRHYQPLSDQELKAVEQMVNDWILEDLPLSTEIMSMEEAKAAGAMALFSEKYGESVRVVRIGECSMELCGGTHLSHSSQACLFRIVSEGGIASGVRRIEAVTGAAAFRQASEEREILRATSGLLRVPEANCQERVRGLLDERRQLEKELQQEKSRQNLSKTASLDEGAELFDGLQLIQARLDGLDPAALRESGDRLRQKNPQAVVLLVALTDDKPIWLAMAGAEAVKRGVHCGHLIREAARLTGGGGGGRPDMAQAGGKDADKIDEAQKKIRDMVKAIAETPQS